MNKLRSGIIATCFFTLAAAFTAHGNNTLRLKPQLKNNIPFTDKIESGHKTKKPVWTFDRSKNLLINENGRTINLKNIGIDGPVLEYMELNGRYLFVTESNFTVITYLNPNPKLYEASMLAHSVAFKRDKPKTVAIINDHEMVGVFESGEFARISFDENGALSWVFCDGFVEELKKEKQSILKSYKDLAYLVVLPMQQKAFLVLLTSRILEKEIISLDGVFDENARIIPLENGFGIKYNNGKTQEIQVPNRWIKE